MSDEPRRVSRVTLPPRVLGDVRGEVEVHFPLLRPTSTSLSSDSNCSIALSWWGTSTAASLQLRDRLLFPVTTSLASLRGYLRDAGALQFKLYADRVQVGAGAIPLASISALETAAGGEVQVHQGHELVGILSYRLHLRFDSDCTILSTVQVGPSALLMHNLNQAKRAAVAASSSSRIPIRATPAPGLNLNVSISAPGPEPEAEAEFKSDPLMTSFEINETVARSDLTGVLPRLRSAPTATPTSTAGAELQFKSESPPPSRATVSRHFKSTSTATSIFDETAPHPPPVRVEEFKYSRPTPALPVADLNRPTPAVPEPVQVQVELVTHPTPALPPLPVQVDAAPPNASVTTSTLRQRAAAAVARATSTAAVLSNAMAVTDLQVVYPLAQAQLELQDVRRLEPLQARLEPEPYPRFIRAMETGAELQLPREPEPPRAQPSSRNVHARLEPPPPPQFKSVPVFKFCPSTRLELPPLPVVQLPTCTPPLQFESDRVDTTSTDAHLAAVAQALSDEFKFAPPHHVDTATPLRSSSRPQFEFTPVWSAVQVHAGSSRAAEPELASHEPEPALRPTPAAVEPEHEPEHELEAAADLSPEGAEPHSELEPQPEHGPDEEHEPEPAPEHQPELEVEADLSAASAADVIAQLESVLLDLQRHIQPEPLLDSVQVHHDQLEVQDDDAAPLELQPEAAHPDPVEALHHVSAPDEVQVPVMQMIDELVVQQSIPDDADLHDAALEAVDDSQVEAEDELQVADEGACVQVEAAPAVQVEPEAVVQVEPPPELEPEAEIQVAPAAVEPLADNQVEPADVAHVDPELNVQVEPVHPLPVEMPGLHVEHAPEPELQAPAPEPELQLIVVEAVQPNHNEHADDEHDVADHGELHVRDEQGDAACQDDASYLLVLPVAVAPMAAALQVHVDACVQTDDDAVQLPHGSAAAADNLTSPPAPVASASSAPQPQPVNVDATAAARAAAYAEAYVHIRRREAAQLAQVPQGYIHATTRLTLDERCARIARILGVRFSDDEGDT